MISFSLKSPVPATPEWPFAPRPITYRTFDFRTNEFRGLEGGERFEPEESNPMIGYRGALRYIREPEVFRLELAALSRVWEAGHRNLHEIGRAHV